MRVKFISTVASSLRLGASAATVTGTTAPVCLLTLSPNPLIAYIREKPLGPEASLIGVQVERVLGVASTTRATRGTTEAQRTIAAVIACLPQGTRRPRGPS